MPIPSFFCNFAAIMPFPFHIDILDTIFNGIIIGIMASAPMGPVGVLCVQRTIKKGRWIGFFTGVGAAISDMLYALITGLGMSFVMDFITRPQTLFFLKILGSLVLLAFGIFCFRANPTRNMHVTKNQKGTIRYNLLTAFLVTLSNPLIVFLFIATYAQFSFVIPGRPLIMSVGYFSIFAGALIWWYGLTWLLDKIREKFDNDVIFLINRIIGTLVIIFSIIILIGTIFNLYSISY